jgi:methylenetetrahydrofolate reductase (NADPH)
MMDANWWMRRLAREASLELNHLEAQELAAAEELLCAGQRVYVSHLPRQTWDQTVRTCAAVAARGFEPVPHIPVRRLGSQRQLDEVLAATREAGARELLLIAGDRASSEGPFSNVLEVLQTGGIQQHGFTRVSMAGHPEGHPAVPAQQMREAQLTKARWAAAAGLEVTLVTQFFFESAPFIRWASELREQGIGARLLAGLPGPATAARLLGLARHCGVGASIRALSSRPGAMFRLATEESPEALLLELGAEKVRQPQLFDGIHLFSFGGFRNTAAWLARIRSHSPLL